jgi:hypothetical protein
VSTRRGQADRPPGADAEPTTQPPPSRPEPGAGGPVLSNGPAPTSPPGPGPRPRPPAPPPVGPALRVVLVSRDNMLAGALRSLIEAPGGVRVLDWHSDELDSAIRHADVVIVDMPPNLHERTLAVVDGRFLGRTVVLLQEGEHPEALPPGPPRAILFRPLQIGELWGAITGALPPVAEAEAPVSAADEPPLDRRSRGRRSRRSRPPRLTSRSPRGRPRRRSRSWGPTPRTRRQPPARGWTRRRRWRARGCRWPSRGG